MKVEGSEAQKQSKGEDLSEMKVAIKTSCVEIYMVEIDMVEIIKAEGMMAVDTRGKVEINQR